MPNADDILWFKKQFHRQIKAAVKDTPGLNIMEMDFLSSLAHKQCNHRKGGTMKTPAALISGAMLFCWFIFCPAMGWAQGQEVPKADPAKIEPATQPPAPSPPATPAAPAHPASASRGSDSPAGATPCPGA